MAESSSSHSNWHRLRLEHLNLKINDKDCVTLNSFRAVTLNNGLSRLIFLGNKPDLSSKVRSSCLLYSITYTVGVQQVVQYNLYSRLYSITYTVGAPLVSVFPFVSSFSNVVRRLLIIYFKSARELDIMYVDIDPLFRSHDLTNWNKILNESINQKSTKTLFNIRKFQKSSTSL